MLTILRKLALDIQALVLTHPRSHESEWEPYLSWRFRPLRPLVFLGRTAASEPPCKKEETVYYAWKDLEAQLLLAVPKTVVGTAHAPHNTCFHFRRQRDSFRAWRTT